MNEHIGVGSRGDLGYGIALGLLTILFLVNSKPRGGIFASIGTGIRQETLIPCITKKR